MKKQNKNVLIAIQNYDKDDQVVRKLTTYKVVNNILHF